MNENVSGCSAYGSFSGFTFIAASTAAVTDAASGATGSDRPTPVTSSASGRSRAGSTISSHGSPSSDGDADRKTSSTSPRARLPRYASRAAPDPNPAPPPLPDTTAPETSITSAPANGSATGASIAFASSEAGSSFSCSLDGGAWGACSSPKSYTNPTVGSHTFCHQDLSKTKGRCLIKGKVQPYEYTFKDEIEKGISAVSWALGAPIAPYFRFPALRQPPEALTYLGQRNVGIFSADFDSFDFKMRRPEQVRQSVLTKLKKHGKGIVLMHDFQHNTAEALPELLRQLKAGGYKIVHMVPKDQITTIAKYDDMVRAQDKYSASNNTRPQSSVVKTISE